jgi:sodium/proline symporter
MIVGAVTVIIWSNLSGGLFDLYEIAPGFLLASLTIVAFSLLRPETSPQVAASFEEVELMLKE